MNRRRLALELRRARGPFLVYVALVVLGAVALGVTLGNQTFRRPWQKTLDIRAVIDDAKGIVPGKAQVRIAGIKVGVISDVQLRDGRAVATLAIDRKYAPIYRDASVRVRPATALQDMYAALRRGTRSAGRLADGAQLPVEQTATPVDVSRILQTFDADTRTHLRTVLVELGRGLDDRGLALRASLDELTPLLTSVQKLAHELSVRRRTVRRLVSGVASLTDVLAQRDRRLSSLVSRGSATLGALAHNAPAVDATLRALPGSLARLDDGLTALRRAQAELDPALDRLRPAVPLLEPAVVSLQRLGSDALPALGPLRTAVQRLAPLARDLRPVSRDVLTTLQHLRPQVPSLDRVTRQLLPCRDVLRQFFQRTNSIAKFSDAGGGIARGEASIGFDTVKGATSLNIRRLATCREGGR